MSQELLDLLLKAVEIVRSQIETPVSDSKSEPEPIWPSKPEPVIEIQSVTPEPILEPLVLNPDSKFDRSLFNEDANRALNLLETTEWPEAVPSFLICEESEDEKFERADGIWEFIGTKLANVDVFLSDFSHKKILDFGCGEGYLAKKAAKFCGESFGYDIKKNESWNNGKRFTFSDDFVKISLYKPYDLIILHDVLDHCEKPLQVLEQVRSLCMPDTVVFIRCHSWMSRHGSHLYKDINKAWVHLFFTEEELKNMGFKVDIKQKIHWPHSAYKAWFVNSRFEVIHSDIVRNDVESFFRKPELTNRFPVFFKNFPEGQMSQSFNDYVLRPQEE